MRLKQLQLAGFKSFVDPTKISLTSALSAVVGPNGCGKSNIIDAVRWVLGESSAKNLRGEGMTDVIFNGSNARKPVSQANVELIFDNSEGKAQGPWQSYSEISVKRQVNRDGQSEYFVNNQKCRRRDITDLLSGTGLGPRSYSIIEQGTISRLVESKPQELRVFIEEAAGITKYKERRRETENRIKHSRDNLSRLSDLKHELDAQVAKLEFQAKEAEQYSSLKRRERQLNQDIIVLRWKNFQIELEQAQTRLEQTQQELSELELEIAANNVGNEQVERQHELLKEQLNKLLQQRYRQEAAVSQAASQVDILAKQRQQQIEQQEQLTLVHDANTDRQVQQCQKVAKIQDDIAKQSPDLPHHSERLAALVTQCHELEQQTEQAEHQLAHCLNTQNSIEQQLELNQHSDGKIAQDQIKLSSQRELLAEKSRYYLAERDILAPESKQSNYQQLRQQHQESLQQQETLQETTIQSKRQLESCHQQLLNVEKNISQIENQISTVQLLIASKQGRVSDELASHYQGHKQLWQQIRVNPDWQRAVELVLGDFIHAYCVDSLTMEVPDCSHRVVEKKSSANTANTGILAYRQLLSEVNCDYQLTSLLGGIYCADHLEQARDISRNLTHAESVITREGQWYGQGFIVINGAESSSQPELGLLELQQQLTIAGEELAEANTYRNKIGREFDDFKSQLSRHQAQQTQSQALTQQYHEQVINAKQQWLLQQQKWQHVCDQYQDVSRQISDLKQLEQLEQQQQQQLSEQRRELKKQHQDVMLSTQGCRDELAGLKYKLLEQRKQQQQLQHDKHDAELNLQKQQMQLNAAELQLTQTEEAVATNERQLARLNQTIIDGEPPLAAQKKALFDGQQQLLATRQQYNEVEQQLAKAIELGQDTKSKDQQYRIKKSRLDADITRLKLSSETLKVKLVAQQQALEISQREIAELAYGLLASNESKRWPQYLTQVKHKLSQIGPINLTAINEYNEQKERSVSLATQIDDLELALATLETAIKKIDRESREKFKLTFDAVNRDFKSLFPKVFGGGGALLTLTDSDLLSSGVSIMAQPPGKKNSTIHLLSGGEKALTALSLVFAIFQLNPAPFCMLDEVDAPLDDANVERYCNLVKEMSETVQFVFITHNKVSMEMADHLTGVTMVEAGVSRVVAVDVAQAISLVQE